MSREVSVIIPVYNAADNLERCVESIVYGELQDIEIILIDDCSKDNSWDICQTLSKRYLNVCCLQNTKNSGVSYTRNQGLQNASGEYILFIDSDDWVSGKYAKSLLEATKKYQQKLVICGLHFLDNVAGYRREYIWNKSKNKVNVIDKELFFELADGFLLQQLWNKIFCRSIIEQYHIRFDESQSMGEDFQFVLDYMEVAKIQQCVVLNEPLYYYIRANNTSLMSNFGLVENDNEYKRYEKLRDLCGVGNPIVEQQYQNAVVNMKYNYVYQICRDVSKSKTEKINFVEHIMMDGRSKLYFDEQQRLIIKEKLSQYIENYKVLPLRILAKLRRVKRDYIIKRIRRKLEVKDFTIISQNCIGGVFYHDMGIEFLSPTVNLFFKAPDFIRFVQNLKYYMSLELQMHWSEEYPIGRLDDVVIYFMHYKTCHEARESWEKRKERIVWERIVILATDMEGFDNNAWEEWEKITYPKVLFSAIARNSSEVVLLSKYREIGHVRDLIPDREFYKDGVLIQVVNDLRK